MKLAPLHAQKRDADKVKTAANAVVCKSREHLKSAKDDLRR